MRHAYNNTKFEVSEQAKQISLPIENAKISEDGSQIRTNDVYSNQLIPYILNPYNFNN